MRRSRQLAARPAGCTRIGHRLSATETSSRSPLNRPWKAPKGPENHPARRAGFASIVYATMTCVEWPRPADPC
jgi:hypothetical protein